MRRHLLLLIAIAALGGTAAAQDLRDRVRAHAMRYPGEPYLRPAAPGEHWPKSIADLAKEAVVVVQGKLTKIGSYVAPSGDLVVTDYSIAGANVIAGRLPATSTRVPGATTPLILTVFGGQVIVEGVEVREFDQNFAAITDGGEYLLFLRESRPPQPGRYGIYYGGIFEIAQDEVKPLLKQGELIFKETVGARLGDLVSGIKAAARR